MRPPVASGGVHSACSLASGARLSRRHGILRPQDTNRSSPMLAELNPEQLAAVTYGDGPLL
ncbi:MAG TPA: hypothetical protein VL117_12530, partial [Thermoleophilia bacterium]|nr:hypothetical protein [Thermoleophilia bacterium]